MIAKTGGGVTWGAARGGRTSGKRKEASYRSGQEKKFIATEKGGKQRPGDGFYYKNGQRGPKGRTKSPKQWE